MVPVTRYAESCGACRQIDPAWLALTVVAAIVEEYACRGVLTGILTSVLGPGSAWILSAGLFGLGHFTQGWRGLVFSAGFGLALQAVVSLSGGLLLAIVAHMAYDLGASWLGRRLARRIEHGSLTTG